MYMKLCLEYSIHLHLGVLLSHFHMSCSIRNYYVAQVCNKKWTCLFSVLFLTDRLKEVFYTQFISSGVIKTKLSMDRLSNYD